MKAGIELTFSTMVVSILAVVVLLVTLGIFLGILNPVKELGCGITDAARQQLAEMMAQPDTRLFAVPHGSSCSAKDDIRFLLGIRNSGEGRKLYISVYTDSAFSGSKKLDQESLDTATNWLAYPSAIALQDSETQTIEIWVKPYRPAGDRYEFAAIACATLPCSTIGDSSDIYGDAYFTLKLKK